MSVWVYENHLGGLYTESKEIPTNWLYCDSCCDSDIKIGAFETFADFIKYYVDDIVVNHGDGGYSIERIIEWVGSAFEDKLTHEQIKEIVLANRTNWEEVE